MFKLSLIIFTAFAFVASAYAQSESHPYKGKDFSCKYQIEYGMLHGRYESFYKNGKKKSEGTFEYNHRIGEWSVWDSTGKLRVKRIYTSPLEYKQIIPRIPSEGAIPLLSKPVYILKRDSFGKLIAPILAQRMVAYQQRNFKCFYTSGTQLFFNCKTLFDILYSNGRKRNIALYIGKKGNEDDTYSHRFDLTTSDSTLIDSAKFTLVGFRIKSDFIFDNTRLVSDERPLFITPLVVNKVNPTDTFDFFSVYMADVRKYLVQYQLAQTILPPYLHNLDDVFFFGCFGVDKWRKSHVYDRVVTDAYARTMPSTANTYLLKEVETENDLWLHFNK